MKRLLTLLLVPSLALGQARDDVEPELDPPGNGNTEIEGDLSEININSPRTTKTYQGAGAGRSMPVSSAISPSLMSSGTSSCLISKSEGLQLVGIGVSRGNYEIDYHCERRLNSQALAGAGMRVAAVALLCQEATIWRSMLVSATPCPVLKNGKLLVGKRALQEIKSNPKLWIPDWEGNEDWYTQVLAGEDNVEENTSGSISDRYRTSKRSGRTGRPNNDQ